MKTLNVRFFLTIILILILTIIPLPEIISICRPSWVLMLALYTQIFLPKHFKILFLLLLGLSLDVLLASVIGEHAFALIFTSYLASSKARRFAFFSITQQILLIGVCASVYHAIIMLIDVSLGNNITLWFAASHVFFTMMFWPWFKLLADVSFIESFNNRRMYML